uniref:Docking protein 2 n=1 Tax=Falco tinnunculus TaxID=100819 RepID=A0A8C4VA81_FALTI
MGQRPTAWWVPETPWQKGAMFWQSLPGPKWKKFWGVLYRESSCSTARLELFEGSVPLAAEKLRKGEGSKRLVKLSDCVHVVEASGDTGCPKETIPFLLETTEKRYLLATDGPEVADWIQKLCELAFPEPAAGKDGQQSLLGTNREFSMEENSLYSSRDKGRYQEVGKAFEVTVRATESSERCRLWGRYILRAGEDALELQNFQTLEILYSWPYRFLRRFGRDKVTFSFEAGRRCASGEGNFEFETRQGNEIFKAIESAINVHQGRGTEEPWQGGPGDDATRPLGHRRGPPRPFPPAAGSSHPHPPSPPARASLRSGGHIWPAADPAAAGGRCAHAERPGQAGAGQGPPCSPSAGTPQPWGQRPAPRNPRSSLSQASGTPALHAAEPPVHTPPGMHNTRSGSSWMMLGPGMLSPCWLVMHTLRDAQCTLQGATGPCTAP